MSIYGPCTVTINGVDVPAESVETTFAGSVPDDVQPGLGPTMGTIHYEFSCTIEGADFLAIASLLRTAERRARVVGRNLRRVGQGARRAHRRREKGRIRAWAQEWIRFQHGTRGPRHLVWSAPLAALAIRMARAEERQRRRCERAVEAAS